MTSTNNLDINKMYDDALKARNDAIEKSTQASQTGYKSQIDNAKNTYNPMRNEAYTQDQTAQRTLRERMANLGLGAGGGKSMTLDNQRQSALLNRMGDISRQQRQYEDNLKTEMSKLTAQGSADKAAAAAENYTQRNQALIGQDQWQKTYEMQQQAQKYTQAWELFKKKKISKSDFYNMTGIRLK
jgi:hypothetical protein